MDWRHHNCTDQPLTPKQVQSFAKGISEYFYSVFFFLPTSFLVSSAFRLSIGAANVRSSRGGSEFSRVLVLLVHYRHPPANSPDQSPARQHHHHLLRLHVQHHRSDQRVLPPIPLDHNQTTNVSLNNKPRTTCPGSKVSLYGRKALQPETESGHSLAISQQWLW